MFRGEEGRSWIWVEREQEAGLGAAMHIAISGCSKSIC